MFKRASLLLLITFCLSFELHSRESLRIAVAANFSNTADQLFVDFEARSGVPITPLIGSTGRHAAQIKNGLVVDVFMAADISRPQWLQSNGLAIEGSRFTYARGRLVLFSLVHRNVDFTKLNDIDNVYLAIANPKTAPYGLAAMEFLENQRVNEDLSMNIVKGESVAQAYQFAASGSADAALIALSQVTKIKQENYWLVPQNLHQPIEQQAVLIRDSKAAKDFMSYLKSNDALNIIERSGYERP